MPPSKTRYSAQLPGKSFTAGHLDVGDVTGLVETAHAVAVRVPGEVAGDGGSPRDHLDEVLGVVRVDPEVVRDRCAEPGFQGW